jgi:fumarylacetoacetase
VSTWVESAAGSGYDVDHLPYGVFTTGDGPPRAGVRVGDRVVDLTALEGALSGGYGGLFDHASLTPFLATGPRVWAEVRAWLQVVLADPSAEAVVGRHLLPVSEAQMVMPFEVADYVDFYASEHHATNVGRIFRPDGDPLMPNWRHLPVGYHGRAGTVVVSGTDVRRPSGQRRPPAGGSPVFGTTERLDLEAELGFVVGAPSEQGHPVSTGDFDAHVFGVVGVNDWSARDVQAWETAPLGPFLGKSFATSISAWVTPMAALEAAWVPLPGQQPRPPAYLDVDEPAGLDVAVEVVINGEVVARPPYASMYWSPRQMLAHMTVNGASLRTGDLFASGTISGPDRDQRGSLLELGWGGTEPFDVGGAARCWLEDGDEVVLRYSAPGTAGGRLTLGEVRGRVTPG